MESKTPKKRGLKPGCVKHPNTGRKKGSPNKATIDKQVAAAAGGELPLDYCLRIMRDAKQSRERRDAMAMAVLPYLHSKRPADPSPTVDAPVVVWNKPPLNVPDPELEQAEIVEEEPKDKDPTVH